MAAEAPGPADPGAPFSPEEQAWMEIALRQGRLALDLDEVPVGAVLVVEGRPLAADHNRTRQAVDPCAHAEILVLREAARRLGVSRLVGARLFTTLEPCLMCAGALLHARLAEVVWATRDPKFGGGVSLAGLFDLPGANHRIAWREGLLAEESRALLLGFFRGKRGSRT
jgi:tRNA(adenine34) deaminase